MQIGRLTFRRCPHCGKNIEYSSGRFFVQLYGLTEWSDGETFEELPSLKKTELQKCHFCNNFFWFRQKLGGMQFKDYCDALIFFEKLYSKKTIINFLFPNRNKKRLLYIRLNILRKYNDKIRVHPLSKGEKIAEPIDENDKNIFINNANKLIELLKIFEPDNNFLISELYRNIGSFEESKAVLNKVYDVNKKNLLLKEIENKNRDVIIIKQPKTKHFR
jgi:tetratricopeptide (TPR) repeat protein